MYYLISTDYLFFVSLKLYIAIINGFTCGSLK